MDLEDDRRRVPERWGVVPLRPCTRCATRAVMIDGAGFGAIATDFYWVVAYTVVIAGLAVVAFRRKMVEQPTDSRPPISLLWRAWCSARLN